MRRIWFLAVAFVAGACSASAAPPVEPAASLQLTALTRPTPTLRPLPTRAAASPSPRPATARQASFGGLSLVRCTFDDVADRFCQEGSLHVSNPVRLGARVRVTVTVKNESSKPAGPVTMMLFGPRDLEYLLPDRFPLSGCEPKCERKTVGSGTMHLVTWAEVPPGTTNLTVMLKAKRAGDHDYQVALVYLDLEKAQGTLGREDIIASWDRVKTRVFAKE